ncbi:relaxase domain-containing protein [Acidithiobacillus sp. HP-6]|uniref:MobF family relaxase n=1 Tax=unclassified Acidithiobacillus TaxID=2614800 RepID=UPI00187B0894|nr:MULTISPECIES: MobF family relaxase [unclassified Acidithiobacillus]MBE7563864.1 relaxase domain-containing protein [Acidithiobacillus sp. HP-6]MBE7567500.1 relaxase domain-containing protein [Acidithiobacillus sp. HP-11]
MSVKETHLKGTPESVIKYVSEQKEAQTVHFSEDETSNYYAENGNVKGVWMGNGAAIQGLSCYVNNSDLEKLLHGVTMDGHDISKRGNHQNNRRMGSDWTFSAPKAASILSIDDSRVKAWMLESVQQAIENFYAREMSHARKGKGGVITEFSDLIVAAGFLHETARAADGIIDPQLHVHVVIPNLIQRADGQWASLRSDYGKKSRKIYALGDAQVAYLMNKMQVLGGYELELRLECDKKGIEHLSFGVQGISREAEDAFSGRKKQIQSYLLKSGIDPKKATRKQKDFAVLNTRVSKDRNVDKKYLKDALRQRAHDAGIDLDSIRAAAAKRAAVTQKQQSCTGMDVTNITVHSSSDFGEDVAISHDYQSAFGPDNIG